MEEYIQNWKWAVAGQKRGDWPEVIHAKDWTEYSCFCRLLNVAMNDAVKAGHHCKAYGTEKRSGEKTMFIIAYGQKLCVKYTPKPRRQDVQNTSREAYTTLNFDTLRGKIAALIYERTLRGLDITRNEIAAATGISINSVTGRTKELLNETEETPVRIDGKDWQLTVSDRRKSHTVNAKVDNQALRFIEWKDKEAQLALF